MIIITESDLLKIVNKVLNEQEDRQFNEDEIEFLYWIFERELKPPFVKGEEDVFGRYPYYNRDGEKIGWLKSKYSIFEIKDSFYDDIDYKVGTFFEFSSNSNYWYTIGPHLKSWLEDHLDIKLKDNY